MDLKKFKITAARKKKSLSVFLDKLDHIVPEDMPVTLPVVSTIATAVLLLVQFPPARLSDKVVELPLQIVVMPLIADGGRLTIMVVVALVVPQLLVAM